MSALPRPRIPDLSVRDSDQGLRRDMMKTTRRHTAGASLNESDDAGTLTRTAPRITGSLVETANVGCRAWRQCAPATAIVPSANTAPLLPLARPRC